MHRAAILLLTLAVAAAAPACRTPVAAARPPLATPQIEPEARHFGGTPVSGPGAPVDPGEPEDALQATVTFIALEGLWPGLEPIGSQARLLLTDKGGAPLRPTADLLSGARAGPVDAEAALAAIRGGAWGRSAPIGDLRGVLPVGVTAAFELRRGDERFVVDVRRAPREGGGASEGIEVAILIAGRGAGPNVVPSGGDRLRRELAVLEARPLTGRNEVAIVAPSPFAGQEARAIAAVVSVGPPPPAQGLGAAAHRAAFAACRADLARDAVKRGDAPRASASTPAPPDTALARTALLDPERRRAALFSLAQGTGARLAEDLAIAGAEPLVATVTAAVAAELGRSFAPADGPVLGWVVERGAMRALMGAPGSPETIDPGELFLLRRAGAVARVEGALRAILERTKDLTDFERRLVFANRALLEDADPGMRARALEWLAARDLAPKGYDPLGSMEARRTALEKAAAGGKKP